MTNISNMFGIPLKSDLKEKSSPCLITDDKVGIEVELEGLLTSIANFKSKKSVNTWWDVVKDGSLRSLDGKHSAEFVFKGPMFGQDVVDSLESLQKVTKKSVSSVRTSVHVHLDVRALEYNQLLRLLCVYLLIEPILFDQVTPDRSNNPYCTPIRGCSGYLNRLGQSLRGNSADSFIGSLMPASGSKYTALNFLPIAKQGSIEFRHKEGTNDSTSIINWTNLVLAFKRYVVEVPEAITSDEICHITDNYREFVTYLFRGVDMPNLQESVGRHEQGAGIVAKALLHEAEQPAHGLFEQSRFEASARDSYFWKAANAGFRDNYFCNYIPDKGTKKRKRVPFPSPPPVTSPTFYVHTVDDNESTARDPQLQEALDSIRRSVPVPRRMRNTRYFAGGGRSVGSTVTSTDEAEATPPNEDEINW